MNEPSAPPALPPPLSGTKLMLAGLALALSNFVVVLDTTIANVSMPHIAGSLGVSVTQGTWVITSYAVAEAICVPLSGWLAQRFGVLRTFLTGLLGFGLFSALCGLAPSIETLVICRMFQGVCGAPLMPLSQTLLMTIFPGRKRTMASTLWSMTTVLGPVAGPLLGGTISADWTWPWIFFINLPIVLLCAGLSFRLLSAYETAIRRLPIDYVGLGLLVIWVGSLQIMLDTGREKDWFSSNLITLEAIVAAIFFVVFVIWELTERHPVVDLKVLRHRGFTVGASLIGLGFFGYVASLVVVPLWLQTNLGYPSDWSGRVSSTTGILAFLSAPVVGRLLGMVDPRRIVCVGFLWLALVNLVRSASYTNMDFWSITLGQMALGAGIMCFMVPNLTMAMASVLPSETAGAAGVMNFMRTMAIALGTSLWTSIWANGATISRDGMVGSLHPDALVALGGSRSLRMIEQMTDQESLTRSMNQVFLYAVLVFLAGSLLVWLIPRPKGPLKPTAAH
jgi:DHA2 family multidrug resistance protein